MQEGFRGVLRTFEPFRAMHLFFRRYLAFLPSIMHIDVHCIKMPIAYRYYTSLCYQKSTSTALTNISKLRYTNLRY